LDSGQDRASTVRTAKEGGDVGEILVEPRVDWSGRGDRQRYRSDTSAIAASDNNPRTYAGDYQGGSLPIGTFIAFQYGSFAHADAFVDPTGRALPDSHANTWVEFTRVTYFAEFANRPLVIEADLPFATLTDVNIPGTNNRLPEDSRTP
jgi:hypothetical protein